MAYICHCDICKTIIEGKPHKWLFKEQEEKEDSFFPTIVIDLCDDCFSGWEHEVKQLINKLKRAKDAPFH